MLSDGFSLISVHSKIWAKGNSKDLRPFTMFEMALFQIRRLQEPALYLQVTPVSIKVSSLKHLPSCVESENTSPPLQTPSGSR